MFAHERSLVQKMRDRPFALLGVNEDSDRETLQGVQKEHELNWRSWWDGGNAIQSQWNPRGGLPTLFLIDSKGVIRWHLPGAPNDFKPLERQIEQLVKEAEAEGGKQASLSRR